MICFGALYVTLYLLQESDFEYQVYAQQNNEVGMNSSDLNITASGFLTYRSPLYGVKIDYPDGSQIHEETNKIYVTIPSNFGDPYYSNSLMLPKVIIETNMEVQPNTSLDSWTRQLISLSIHRADPEPMAFKIISINKTKISDGFVQPWLTFSQIL